MELMDEKLKNTLRSLADKYECADFLKNDPSQFMHRYEKITDIEVSAFIAANLAFGRRSQILSHVESVLAAAGKSPAEWILSDSYNDFFPESDGSFYRMYSFNAMRLFCSVLKQILEQAETLGDYFKKKWQEAELADSSGFYRSASTGHIYLAPVIASSFPMECNLIPHSMDSAAKKLNMLLRWLVRSSSPVDVGIWTWYKTEDLLMPLDTHVVQEATRFGLLPAGKGGKPKSAGFKSAVLLTEQMTEVFGKDPVRGDFALFGLGVDKDAN